MLTRDIGLSVTEATPLASLATHLNNPAMHKRAPVSQAIADIRIAVEDYFCEYLRQRRFKKFHPPSLIGAASEGGANVFRLLYFDISQRNRLSSISNLRLLGEEKESTVLDRSSEPRIPTLKDT